MGKKVKIEKLVFARNVLPVDTIEVEMIAQNKQIL
jgi:hypothetical protein